MNGTTFGTPTRRLAVDRLAPVIVTLAALLALVALVATAVAAGAGGFVFGALGLAAGVALVTALPFLVVRALSDAALR